MRLSAANLVGRTVVATDGTAVGEIATIVAGDGSRGFRFLRVKLGIGIAQFLGTFDATTVDVPIRLVQSVGEKVVLSIGVAALGDALGKDVMISVVDLANGTVSERPADTRTLDVPRELDRQTPVASLDAASRVRCASTSGKTLVYLAFTTPLSSRARGEECLVAERSFRATAAHPASYRVCNVVSAQ
jgi:sporulation protein YlmC with PRC-barrel domain